MTRPYVTIMTVIVTLASFWLANAIPLVPFSYHSYSNLTERLQVLADAYPSTSYLYSIGKSAERRELWVMAIGKQPRERVLLRPNVKFVGSIHGDEAPPKEILLHFIEYLLKNYGRNESVTSLLDSSLVHVLPLMNPDGSTHAVPDVSEGPGRENANGEDLNVNFPDYFHPEYLPNRQPETAAIMDWVKNTSFVLSASVHVGAMLVDIPYDNYLGSKEEMTAPSPTPDDDVFRHLAAVYSATHPDIPKQNERSCDHEFHPDTLVNGIINGAEWSATNGTMLDYNYAFGSCMEVTLEVGCLKYPRANRLMRIWLDNRDALLNFARGVNIGVRGLIMDEKNNPVTDATVTIDQRMPVNVSSRGEFWKLLLPSSLYLLEVTRAGRRVWRQNFMVVDGSVTEVRINLGNLPPTVVTPDALQKKSDVKDFQTRSATSGFDSTTPCWRILTIIIAIAHALTCNVITLPSFTLK